MDTDEDGEIVKYEWCKVSGLDAGFEGTEDGGEDGGDVGEELLVVAGDFCPPWIYVGAEGESDEGV